MFYKNNKPHNVIPTDTASNSSSSKLTVSISHSKPQKKKLPPVVLVKKTPHTLVVKSKSDLNNNLKTYPDSFTIVSSPKRSPSAGYQNKRRKNINDDDDDSIMDFEWVKPPPEMLYEASKASEENIEEPTYIADHFGQHVSMPTSPIITDKIIVGSSHR